MKLARFNSVRRQIEDDQSIRSTGVKVAVYRYFDGIWIDDKGTKVEDATLTTCLETTRLHAKVWRARKSKVSYFPLPELGGVVVATFPAPPQRGTTDRISKQFRECIVRGTNAFDAAHDRLTEFANKATFDLVLKREIERLTEIQSAAIAAPEQVETRGAVSVISFDIDFFKQVNDTFGHIYGDLVLQLLAQRVERACQEFQRSQGERVRVVCARPGGEEFAIVLAGAYQKEDEAKFAEAVRAAVSEVPLPSDAEWGSLAKAGLPEGMVLPHIAERRVTVSVGSAFIRGIVSSEKIDEICTNLKNRADLALYRAKAAGRNKTVAFSDILQSYGRVLEHKNEADVVAIDVGRLVGVRAGQEFVVYNPQFTGREPFIFQDGRTHKRLGTYPRVAAGRIEVFNVQSDISFCRVLQQKGNSLFAIGSVLEAVPLGSITHLVASGELSATAIAPLGDLEGTVKKISESDRCASVCVASLAKADSLADAHGIAFVNRVLADLFAAMREKLPGSAVIGQIAPTHLAAVLPSSEPLTDDRVRPILDLVKAKYRNIPQLAAGIFNENDRSAFDKGRAEKLDASGALTLARYALITAENDSVDVRHFNRGTPQAVLYMSRRSRDFSQASQDYEIFNKHHAETSGTENQLALIAYEKGDFEEAAEYIDRAIKLAPGDHQLWLNAGLVRYHMGDASDAFKSFKEAIRLNPDHLIAYPYSVAYAWSYHSALEDGLEGADLSEGIKVLETALNETNKQHLNEEGIRLLNDALKELSSRNEEASHKKEAPAEPC